MVNTIQPAFKDCLTTAASNLPVNGTLIENVEKCASSATLPTAPATSETITEENSLLRMFKKLNAKKLPK